MKKRVKKSLVSLILCAAMSCVIGAFAAMSSFTAKAENSSYATLDSFLIEETASVRAQDYTGIRFTTDISDLSDADKAKIDALKNKTYGTLVLPADFLGNEALTHDTAKVVDIVTENWQNKTETTYTSVLVGAKNEKGKFTSLPSSYNNRPLAARSYVTGTDSNGDTVTYYTSNTATRSIGYVAYMAKFGGHATDLINEIVDNTKVELVFDEKVSVHQGTPDGTPIIANKHDKSTDNAIAVKIGGITVPLSEVDPDAVVSYTSYHPDVISVSGETLTAKKPGEATIKATVTINGEEYTLTETLSTDVYEPKSESEYKILISEAAYNAPHNSGTSYLPATGNAYTTYNLAYEKTAAYTLRDLLAEATGVELEIVTAIEDGVKYISVGNTALSSDVTFGKDAKDTTAKVQVDTDGNIIILGKTEEGTLYGVQRWLHDVAGYTYCTRNTYILDKNAEIFAKNNEYVRDIEFNVTQTSKLDYNNGTSDLDGYGMRSYTQHVIPVGTTPDQDATGFYYQGIAHNSVVTVQGEGFAGDTAEPTWTYVDGNTGTLTKHYWSGYSTSYPAYSKGTHTYADKFVSNVTENDYKHWYATYSKTFYYKRTKTTIVPPKTTIEEEGDYEAGQFYHQISNPSYSADAAAGTLNSYPYIKAELCYTAHGQSGDYGRDGLVDAVASAMYQKMQNFPEYDRIGFSHMDHSIWCECSSCDAHGNASANLLEFLLDVAASLKTKLGDDPRAETFQICSLFYHKTNPYPNFKKGEPTEKLENYMKHIEVWFAETGYDQIDALDDKDTTNDWNETVYEYMKQWAQLCKTYSADMLWWGYYGNTTSQFIPFNTIDAMRANYAIASDLGVDTMFNQMMEFQTNFSGLKYYLMSKLTVKAKPDDDDEWNGWIEDYFKGAYGQGATDMKAYYDLWAAKTNEATVKNLFRRDTNYNEGDAGTASIAVDARDSWIKVTYDSNNKTYSGAVSWDDAMTSTGASNPKSWQGVWDTVWTTDELEKWIASIDSALQALDVADPNYETYYSNIMIEKLLPMYLLMWVHDQYKPAIVAMNTSGWYVIDYNQTGSFNQSEATYVNKYGAEFLTWLGNLNITNDGEGRPLTGFCNAIKAKLGEGATSVSNVVVDNLIIAKPNTTLTLTHPNLTAEYTTVRGDWNSATVEEGKATINVGSLELGETYGVIFADKKGNSVAFTNIKVVTEFLGVYAGADSLDDEGNGYYIIERVYTINEGETEIWLDHPVLTKGTYTVTTSGQSVTSTVFSAGKIKVAMPYMPVGNRQEVLVVDENNNTFVFTVVMSALTDATIEATGKPDYLTELSGDAATSLGFASGTAVYQAEMATNEKGEADPWNSRIRFNVTDTKADYISVDFTVSEQTSFFTLWPSSGGSYAINANGISINEVGKTDTLEILIYDQDGNSVDKGPWKPDMIYTLVVYLQGENERVTHIALSSWGIAAGEKMYFAEAKTGYVTTIVNEELIEVSTGEFTLPAEVEGTIRSVALGDKGIAGSIEGSTITFKPSAMPSSAASLGQGAPLTVITDKGIYNVISTIVTKVIRTAQELQDLGVGGRTVDGNGNTDQPGHDNTGYYILGNDIDGSGYYFAAGLSGYESYFKGTFDGCGYTVYNVVVSEGGIFGGISTATIKNVNFVNVEYHDNSTPNIGRGYNGNKHYGQYFGLLGCFAASTTIENINVQVTKSYTTDLGATQSGLIVGDAAGGNNHFRNINIDASGLTIGSVLGKSAGSDRVEYENVNIKAATYINKGFSDGASTPLTGWPAGVTFTTVSEIPNNYLIWHSDKAWVSNTDITHFYAGDVTSLGFEEGTLVQYAAQDIRSGAWGAGANGLTMEQQAVVLTKTADEDYASVQFAVSRDFSSNNIFFCWPYGSNSAYLGNLHISKTGGSNGIVSAKIYNLDGTEATDVVAGTAYELRLYSTNATKFVVGCFEANGQPFTVYYANPTTGSDVILDNRVTVDVIVTTTEANGAATATFTAPLDVSDVKAIVGDESVTMKINNVTIYEGVLSGDTLSFDASLLTAFGNQHIFVTYADNILILPAYINVFELNQTNAGSPLKLQAILNTMPNANYVLTSDLDMGGNALKAVSSFNGVLDGNGYAIINTKLDFKANSGYHPVFIIENRGTITNIGFVLSDNIWGAGGRNRGIAYKNYGTISNVYVGVTLNTTLSATVGHSPSGAADATCYNSAGILGFENAGTVENVIVDIKSVVALDNYTIAGLYYKNTSNGTIKNSYVVTDVEYVEPIWIQNGTADNATKYADWSAVDTDAITSGNGWSDVWSVDTEGSLYFGDICLYESVVIIGATISATDKPEDLTVYEGNVSDLGFAADTTVYQAAITDGWSSRIKVTPEKLDADFLSFDFTVSATVNSFMMWPSSGGAYSINVNGISIHEVGQTDTIKIVIYDQNGNFVDKGPWVPGTVYTLRVYLQGANERLTDVQFSTFETGCSIYLANATAGYESTFNEIIELGSGEFTLPNGIRGTVQGATLNGTSIFDSVSGKTIILNEAATQIKAADLGRNKTLIIVTDQARYVFEVTAVTKVIKTADDIFNLGVGGNATTGLIRNSHEAGHDVTGYYLLGNDIDCGGKLFAAGHSYLQSFFKGVFDGNGKTISNFHIGAGGIFGGMQNAMVKNVNFEGVTMNGDVDDDGFWSNYTALFAHYAYGTTFEDINVEIVTINTARRQFPVQDGLLVEGNKEHCTFRNIVVDATDLTVENALGTKIGNSTNVTFENVTIYAGDVTRIGYVGTEEGRTEQVAGTDTNSDGKDDATGKPLNNEGEYTVYYEYEYLTEWPAGVTFVKKITNTALQYKKGGNVPVYNGNEKDKGFAEGTTVYHYTAPAALPGDIWSVMGANGIKLTKSTFEDYASVQFVLGRDYEGASTGGAFYTWIHVLPDNAPSTVYAAGGWLYQDGRIGAGSESHFPANQNNFRIVIYDEDGDLVTSSNPLKSGHVYTLYAYCDYMVDIELCVYAISGQPMDVYYANPSSGNVKTAVMEEAIDISAGEFTLPDSVKGNVLSVSLGGKGIMSSAEGNTVVLNSAAAQLVAADLGKGKTLVVVTDKGYYEIEATVVTKVIKTVEELQELGVGGGIETGGDKRDFGGRSNSFEKGHDVIGYYLLGNDIDASGYYFAAGYFGYQSYFRGTFDGNGHTIYNVVVSEGGIFGGISNATIKNVNFVNVEYHGNGAPLPKTQTSNLSGEGYNNTTQYGQQMGLIAQYAVSSTIENINVQVAALKTTGTYGKESGAIVYKFGSGNEVRNINIDASGLTFNNVLGKDVSSANVTFTNVNIKAADSTAIGYSGSTLLETWPAGVTFTKVTENPNSYAIWHSEKAYVSNTEILPFYAGDVKELGFAEGTKVQYAEQDIRTSMWNDKVTTNHIGTQWGLTAEEQAVRFTKTADYDYVSVQFALSRDLTGGSIFFAWCYDAITGNGTGCTTLSVSKSTGKGSGGSITVQIYNLDGTVATNIVAGTAYEMRWYTTGDYRFQIACHENNGQPITVYYANPTVGNDA